MSDSRGTEATPSMWSSRKRPRGPSRRICPSSRPPAWEGPIITAYVGLIEKAQLQEGETVLVTGASGGVGSSVAKLAKTKSARVIGVDLQAPDPETARRLGIDLALSSRSDDIPARVKQFTQGKGVNVAFDCVGGPLFEVSLKTLAPGGRQVNIVSVGERRVSFDLVDFFIRRLSLFGLSTLSYRFGCIRRHPGQTAARFRAGKADCARHREDVLHR